MGEKYHDLAVYDVRAEQCPEAGDVRRFLSPYSLYEGCIDQFAGVLPRVVCLVYDLMDLRGV